MHQGPRLRPLVLLLAGDGEFAVLNGDFYTLPGVKPGVLDPSSGKSDPRKERRISAFLEGLDRSAAITPGLLNGHEPFRNGWTCFKIGVSCHINS